MDITREIAVGGKKVEVPLSQQSFLPEKSLAVAGRPSSGLPNWAFAAVM
jgi:hypothetical protein